MILQNNGCTKKKEMELKEMKHLLVERIATNLSATANVVVVHAGRIIQRDSFIQFLSVNIKVSTILWQHLALGALILTNYELKQTALVIIQ